MISATLAASVAVTTSQEGQANFMPTEIYRDDVRRLLADGAQLVDVLPGGEYEADHLPGAISVPLKSLDAETTAGLGQQRPVIVYCWDYQ
jgi:rhodanese-related sulfurtransferase